MKSNTGMRKALISLSVIAFLCVFVTKPIKALTAPSRSGYTSSMFYENLNFEVYETGYTSSNTSYSITMDGEASFSFDELNVNGYLSSQYNDGTRNIIIDSDMNVTGNQYNVGGSIDLSDITFSLEGDQGSGGNITSSYRYTYTKVQRIAIGFSGPAAGYIKVTPTNVRETGWSYRPLEGCTVLITTADASTNTFTVRPNGNNYAYFELYKTYENVTSLTTNTFVTITSSSFDDTGIIAYESPVSDESTHGLIATVNNWLESIHTLLNQAQQGVSDLNDDLADKAQDLDDLGTSMHSTETNIFDSMDTALNAPEINLNISNLISSKSKPRNAFKWVADQLQYIAVDLGSDITDFWGYLFIFPLILGIAFIIIGRMR